MFLLPPLIIENLEFVILQKPPLTVERPPELLLQIPPPIVA